MAEVNKDPGKTIAPTNLADVVVGTVGKITPADALGSSDSTGDCCTRVDPDSRDRSYET